MIAVQPCWKTNDKLSYLLELLWALAAVARGNIRSTTEAHRPHACYATMEDIGIDTKDITFQAFDKYGSIVGRIPVGDLHCATTCSEQHQHYDSDQKLLYERKWLLTGAKAESKQKKVKKSRDVIPRQPVAAPAESLDTDSSSSDTFEINKLNKSPIFTIVAIVIHCSLPLI